MLTERERHQLASIERELQRCDPGFSALFTGRPRKPRSLLYARGMVGGGLLLLVTAVLLSLDAVFVEGLVLASLGAAWWALIVTPSTDTPGRHGRGRSTGPEHDAEPW